MLAPRANFGPHLKTMERMTDLLDGHGRQSFSKFSLPAPYSLVKSCPFMPGTLSTDCWRRSFVAPTERLPSSPAIAAVAVMCGVAIEVPCQES